MSSLKAFVLVACGGAFGSAARYGVSLLALRYFGARLPLGTLFVNVTGCFLIGLLMTWLERSQPAHAVEWRLVLAVGFLGGFTTFSTFALESYTLGAGRGDWWISTGYLAGSVVLGLLALRFAILLAR